MLRWRLVIGTLLVVVLVLLCWLDARSSLPGVWLSPVLLFFGILGTQEILALCEATGLRPVRWTTYAGSVLVLVSPWIPLICKTVSTAGEADRCGFRDAPMLWPSLAFALAIVLIVVGEIRRYEKPGGVVANAAAAAFGVAYVAFLLSFAVQLRLQYGIAALASLILVVKAGDTGAYTVGRLIGRHKLAPKLSPGKTIEGAAGALIFSVAASWAMFHWLVPVAMPGTSHNHPLLFSHAVGTIVYGVLLGAVGMLGDLAESLIKRDSGRKDSSTWLPGLGGVLDIADSILLAAPVAYLLWLAKLV